MPRPDRLYRKLLDDLRHQILNSFAPGEALPSERVLGDAYGLSKSTVRRALHELSREDLVAVRPRMGWVRKGDEDRTQKRVKKSDPLRVGLISYYQEYDWKISRGAPSRLYKVLYREAEARGIELIRDPQPRRSKRTPARARIDPSRVSWNLYDVSLLIDFHDNVMLADPQFRRHKVVVVDQDASEFGLESVAFDDHSAGCMAAQHLCELGHRRFAVMGEVNSPGWPWDPCWLSRRFGFESWVGRTGGMIRSAWRLESGRHRKHDLYDRDEYARSIAAAWAALPLRERPTALFATDTGMLPVLVQELTRRGLRYPRDLSIITAAWGEAGARASWNEADLPVIAGLPLTTICLDLNVLVRRALDLAAVKARQQVAERRKKERDRGAACHLTPVFLMPGESTVAAPRT